MLSTGAVSGTGYTGANVITGNAGDNILTGGAGNDVLKGLAGADTFVFAAGFGKDVIGDFAAGLGGGDVIQFEGGLFADLVDLKAHAVDTAAGLVITTGADTLTLTGVTKAQLDAGDFLFL